jgi:Fe-S-cluster containining protein
MTDASKSTRLLSKPYGRLEVQIKNMAMTPLLDGEGEKLLKIQPYVPVENPCRFCPGKCCRMAVKTSLPDVVRFLSVMGVPFLSAFQIVPGIHEENSFLMDDDPRFREEGDGWPGRAEIELRRNPGDGSCAYLKSLGGFDRCSVYDVRPSACRLYPLSWQSELSGRKGGPGMVVCPVPYAVSETTQMRAAADVEASIDGWMLHERTVSAWNAESRELRSLDEFLAFALPYVASQTGMPTDGLLDNRSSEERLRDAQIYTGVVRPPKS